MSSAKQRRRGNKNQPSPQQDPQAIHNPTQTTLNAELTLPQVVTDYCTAQKKKRDGLEVAKFIAQCIGIIAVIIALGLTREANSISRAALLSVQRAFVSYHGMEITAESIQQGSYNFSPVWFNSGTTPTKSALSHVSWLPLKLQPDFKFPDIAGGPNIQTFIAPKDDIKIGPLPIPIDALRLVTADSPITFWGWVVYRDVFRESPIRVSEFCQELQNVSGNIATGVSVTFRWQQCQNVHHTCADEECADYSQMVARLK